MIKVYQENRDDCLRACIASILEVDYKEVPDFHDDENVNGAIKWVYKNFGLLMLCSIMPKKDDWNLSLGDVYHIRSFQVKRSPDYSHAVVAKSGKIIHDPNRHANGKDYISYNHDYFFIHPMINGKPPEDE